MSTSRRFPSGSGSWACAAVLCLVVGAGSSPGTAADFTVDSLTDAGDTAPGDGVCDSILAGVDCTLRAAVQEANALSGADHITIPTLAIVLNLAGNEDAAVAGDLDVTDDLEIVGSAFTTVESTHGEAAFEVRSGSLALSNLTLTDGGIVAQSGAALEVTDVELDSRIENYGHATLRRVSSTGSSGNAIYNSGNLTVSESTVSAAGAYSISNSGSMLVERSLILDSGPIVNDSSGRAHISNTRLDGNLIFDGPNGNQITNHGWISLSHVTLEFFVCEAPSCAPAAIWNTGTFLVGNSALRISVLGICFPLAVPLTSTGYNVVEDGSCITAPGPGDIISTAYQDHVPEARCALVDRTGIRRPVTGPCDAGADEIGVSLPACSDGLDDDGDGFIDLQDPGCRDALDPSEAHIRGGDYFLANFDVGGASIFDPVTTHAFPLNRASGGDSPWDIHVDAEGEVIVSDSTFGALTRFDVEDGSARLVSGGDQLDSPSGIAEGPGGEIFVGDGASDVVVSVDRSTGVQTLLSSDPAHVGIDDLLFDPGDGSLLVSDVTTGLHRLTDPLGSPSVSSFTASTTTPRQLVFDGTGDVILADQGLAAPRRFDPVGDSTSTLISTTPFTSLQGAGSEPSGLFPSPTTSTA
jgi:CSLREA domain-containing protein